MSINIVAYEFWTTATWVTPCVVLLSNGSYGLCLFRQCIVVVNIDKCCHYITFYVNTTVFEPFIIGECAKTFRQHYETHVSDPHGTLSPLPRLILLQMPPPVKIFGRRKEIRRLANTEMSKPIRTLINDLLCGLTHRSWNIMLWNVPSL